MPDEKRNAGGRSPLALAGMGMELAVTVLLVAAAGRWLDRVWGTEPWMLILGAALGMVIAMANLLRRVGESDGKGRNGED